MTTTHRNLIRRVLILAVVLVLFAAGCSDDDTISLGDSDATSTTTTGKTLNTTAPSPSDPPEVPLEEISEIDAEVFIDDYGCGHGFAAGNRDQSMALIIYANGGYGDGPDVTAPVVFPSKNWTGEIQIGTDLFGNWCDDLIEQGEPMPVVEQRWPLVGGSLIVDANASGATCDGTVVNGLLREAVAESPSGEHIELPSELTLTNTGWGCFAG